MTPNDPYRGRTAPLISKHSILYIYSTNIGTEYFKRGIYFTFFLLQNTVCFIILTYLVSVLFTFYVQGVLKLKKNNSGARRLITMVSQNSTSICHMFAALKLKLGSHKFRDDDGVKSIGTRQKTTQETGS